MRLTQRSKPAGALQAPLAGVYVQVVPPSLEYSIAAVTPAGSVADAVASLYCTQLGIESTMATLDALAEPVLVSVDVKVRFVPGRGAPNGLTTFPIVSTGRITVTTKSAADVFTVLPTERPRSRSVSTVPTGEFPIR